MHSYQQGDKVRHKAHGHVLDVLSVDGDMLNVGFTYADVHVCEWSVDEVEPVDGLSESNSNLFYIQDTRQYVGNDLLFWGKERNGYTCHVSQAGLYTKEEAARQNQRRHTDVPWPKDYIDARIGTSVDAQHVSTTEALSGTGIELKEAPKSSNRPDQCHGCGKFVSKNRSQPECPHCQTDLSS